ncbi:MAG: hypothetical protein J7L26_12520 [Candidatus Aminicenantes bacterium]|nr:hypothetical protein [Candidatus Aminicenantes bacterium]
MAKEKFPLRPEDLSPEQKERVQHAEYEWKEGTVVKELHGLWRENIAWFYGDQYTVYNPNSNELEDISKYVDREVKNVYNRILPLCRQIHGEINYPHSFYVEPNTTEPEDIKAAKLGSIYLEYTNTDPKWRFSRKVSRAKWWAIVTGNVYWKEFWNKNLWGLVVDNKGNVAKEQGDIDFDLVNPFNARPDPTASTFHDWRWFIEGKPVPKHQVEAEFGLPFGSLPSDPLYSKQDDIFGKYKKSKDEEMVIRFEYWERPNPKYPKGRFMVIASGWVLYDGDNPNPEGQLPYFQLPGIIPFLNTQWYESIVNIAKPAQRQFNRYCSLVDEYIENFKPKNMVPRGSLNESEFKIYTSKGIDFVFYNPTAGGTPHWQNPPDPPPILINWLAFMENEFETETSVRKISYGQLPKYAQRASGILFQNLKMQDQLVISPFVEEFDEALAEAMKFRLQLAQQHYSVQRLIKITGKNKETSVIFLRGIDLRDNTDVRVKPGYEPFAQKERKAQVVDALINKGMIKDARKALEILGFKEDIEEYMEEEFIDERYAYRIIDQIKRTNGKTYPQPHPDDNHEVIFRILNNERKKEEFETWPEGAKKALLELMEKHKEMMQAPEQKEEIPPSVKEEAVMAGGETGEQIPPELLAALVAQAQGQMPEGGY